MEKCKVYQRTKFDSKTIAAAEIHIHSLSSTKISYHRLDVASGETRWAFDTLEEFLAAADQGSTDFRAVDADHKISLAINTIGTKAMVTVDHLHEKHDYSVQAYEIGSRAGHTIRDILEEMLRETSFALLVMTGEDETKDGKTLARQNVVHEAGLFQGKLGFGRAIILLEAGTEEFSNIEGLQQIRFSKGNIKESFGDVVAVLRREFD